MNGLVGQIVKETYHFTEYIGRGGMAEVYKVWDSQRVIHLAAKVLNKDMALDKVFLRRFKREADTLTQLQHPHIIRSYGLQQEGRLAFLLMDFVEGESLKELIFDADGPLPVEKISNILRPVTGALHYAHSQGFVHCDIKPANIMLDKYGEVRVADFGIARVTDAATATMVGAGTPAYMAPEQVKGQDPTPQTDIYALGIVLFEMLTGGERPFTGETASMTGSTSEKIRREQLTVKPPSLRKFNPNISSALDALVQKCLAKDPAARYQNPLEVMNDFERAVGGATVQPPVSKPAPKPKPIAPPPAPVQAAPPPPKPVQPKPVAPQSTPQSSPTQKKKFPVWGYVIGGIALLGILLFGVFNLGVNRAPVIVLPTSTKILTAKTPQPTAIQTLTPQPDSNHDPQATIQSMMETKAADETPFMPLDIENDVQLVRVNSSSGRLGFTVIYSYNGIEGDQAKLWIDIEGLYCTNIPAQKAISAQKSVEVTLGRNGCNDMQKGTTYKLVIWMQAGNETFFEKTILYTHR